MMPLYQNHPLAASRAAKMQRFQICWCNAIVEPVVLRMNLPQSAQRTQSRGWTQAAPFPPRQREGEAVYGMETGTPIPDGFQATRWNRRIRNAPMATRGTDARPNTSSARKRSFAHISCVGLRHPSDRRESTPVSKTCHSV